MPNLMAKFWPGRLAGVLGAAWSTFMVTAGTALAETAAHGAEHAGGAEHGGGGLPQLDPNTFAPQLFWLAISFGVLYYLMSKVALPRVAEVLEARQERITHDLDKAAALKEESQTVIQAYEKALAEARNQALAVMAETTAEMDAAAKARQQGFMADLNARVKAAEANITAAREAAMANVKAVAADIAQDIVSKVAGVKADKAKADGAVTDMMKEPA